MTRIPTRTARIVAASAALLLLTACSQSPSESALDETPDAAVEPTTSDTSQAEEPTEVVIPAEAAEYCAIVLADPQFDRPPETPEEYEEQYTAFLENDRRLAEAAPPEVAEDVSAVADEFADFVAMMEANGWSTEGLDDVEIWDQERVDRVNAYNVDTCGAPEPPQ